MNDRTYDLEKRLINFSVSILDICEKLPSNYVGQYLGKQISRSSISPALNYGEVQAAESRKDFIHKMSICLKELKETRVSLTIIYRKAYLEEAIMKNMLEENEALIAIFAKSIHTASQYKK